MPAQMGPKPTANAPAGLDVRCIGLGEWVARHIHVWLATLSRGACRATAVSAAQVAGGVQYEALAASLDMPLETIQTHLYRAKRRLRELQDQ
jgi:DNA-directed RNA polymerase specialized sigma24 family protein